MSDSQEREEAAGPSETLRPESAAHGFRTMKNAEDTADPGSPTHSGGGSETHRPRSPVPSCVSMNSDMSLPKRPDFSSDPPHSEPKSETHIPPSPVPSCVSMNSDMSLPKGPDFSSEPPHSESESETHRPPSPSCVSVKSDMSRPKRPDFSSEPPHSESKKPTVNFIKAIYNTMGNSHRAFAMVMIYMALFSRGQVDSDVEALRIMDEVWKTEKNLGKFIHLCLQGNSLCSEDSIQRYLNFSGDPDPPYNGKSIIVDDDDDSIPWFHNSTEGNVDRREDAKLVSSDEFTEQNHNATRIPPQGLGRRDDNSMKQSDNTTRCPSQGYRLGSRNGGNYFLRQIAEERRQREKQRQKEEKRRQIQRQKEEKQQHEEEKLRQRKKKLQQKEEKQQQKQQQHQQKQQQREEKPQQKQQEHQQKQQQREEKPQQKQQQHQQKQQQREEKPQQKQQQHQQKQQQKEEKQQQKGRKLRKDISCTMF
ncbi:activating signal cointegrator 1 complex subunit 2 homolog isoform X2 [Sardina pilchardus]|uniref:activating signal cointegrator 1 complex subunit 2 homolog isoform X2 n=1 Tax=Sardina pilchardus TaxID=27697 RepID=UPI002E167F60